MAILKVDYRTPDQLVAYLQEEAAKRGQHDKVRGMPSGTEHALTQAQDRKACTCNHSGQSSKETFCKEEDEDATRQVDEQQPEMDGPDGLPEEGHDSGHNARNEHLGLFLSATGPEADTERTIIMSALPYRFAQIGVGNRGADPSPSGQTTAGFPSCHWIVTAFCPIWKPR